LVIYGTIGTVVTFGTPVTIGTVTLVTLVYTPHIIPGEFWCILLHVTFGTPVGTLHQ